MYIHNLDPFAIKFTETFGIRWYGLSYLLGFFFAYVIIRWFVSLKISPLTYQQASDFIFIAALGIIIGGRLGYCLLYQPKLLFELHTSFPFWGLLEVNKGGMASHGGIIGVIVACFYFGRKNKINTWHLTDIATLGGTLGILFGRIANFINGELVGRACVEQHPWCMKFPQDILNWPYQFSDKLASLADVMTNFQISKDQWLNWCSTLSFSPIAFNNIQKYLYQTVDAIQAGNSILTNQLSPLLTARHPSQLYEALLEGLFMFIVLILFWRKPRKPGAVTIMFLSLYSVVRIIGEQFRMPDSHIGYQLFNLTRGQWLSIGMLTLAAILYFVVSHQKVATTYSGWNKRS